ncbi:uncharacterized protein [Primulina eburnea]|uniref:uncharacterized protein n=1 Tax=Primulina eburnea TaxID=1245227 RepID=UPI003C6C5BAF
MPLPMRIQPIDCREWSLGNHAGKAPVSKSRLKRLLDKQFNSVMKISSADKPATGTVTAADFEPSSACLDKMVQNFMEENSEKHLPPAAAAVKYGRCNCFNGSSNLSSEDEFDFFSDHSIVNSSSVDPSDTIKNLVPCATVAERNLLAETSKIVEKNKSCKRKDDLRKIVSDGLIALHYDASACKSKWEKSSSIPAGEYEYIDVIIDGERLLVDVDFRSEFEIARSTGVYETILRSLPYIFVGKSDRLLKIVSLTSEAARQSLKKKGMHIAPWRDTEYMKSKWFGPYTRMDMGRNDAVRGQEHHHPEVSDASNSEYEGSDLLSGENTTLDEESGASELMSPVKKVARPVAWQLPALRPKNFERRKRLVVTGLASLLEEKFRQ